MTANLVYFLSCDYELLPDGTECTTQYDAYGEIARDLRDAAAQQGWAHRRSIIRYGNVRGLDLCPQHAGPSTTEAVAGDG